MARRSVTLLLAATLTVASVTSCSSEDPPAATSTTAAPAPESITAERARSAEDTMVLVTETVLSVRPLSEQPGDAWRRADAVLSPEGHFPHRGPQVSVPRGRGPWFDWQARGVERVEAHARVTNEEHPADTDTVAARVLEVHLTEVTTDGTRTGGPVQTYYVTTTRTGPEEPWRVEALMQP